MQFRSFFRRLGVGRRASAPPAAEGQPRICGVCIVRNALDLIPALCGHYLRIGFDRLSFLDDHSNDGTAEALEALMRADDRVVVHRSTDPVFRQRAMMNDLANAALQDGYEIVFPFDSDEFWNVDAARIRAMANGPGVLAGTWVQFVQDREAGVSDRRNLTRVRYRAPLLGNTNAETVARQERSFLCLTEPKVGFRAQAPVDIQIGQHFLTGGPSAYLAEGLELFHLPFRSRDAIYQRGLEASRTLQVFKPGENWQSGIFRDAVAERRLPALWAAHSASSDGFLDLPDRRVPLIEDDRLQRLMAQGIAYLGQHHPRVLTAMPMASVPSQPEAPPDTTDGQDPREPIAHTSSEAG